MPNCVIARRYFVAVFIVESEIYDRNSMLRALYDIVFFKMFFVCFKMSNMFSTHLMSYLHFAKQLLPKLRGKFSLPL